MGVMDRYSEKKKKKDEESTGGKSASGGVAERYERNQYYQTLDTDSVDENYINSFISDTNTFFKGVKENSISYDAGKSTFGDLSTRYDTIQGWLYKNNINEEKYASLSSTFDGLQSSFDGLKDFYSRWDNEDEYKKAVEQEEAEKKALEDKLNFDFEAGQKEIDELNKLLEEYDYLILRQSTADPNSEANVRLRELRSQYGSKADIQGLVSEKIAYMEEAKLAQKSVKLASVNNPGSENYDIEFDKYTGYTPGKKHLIPTYEDLAYDVINGNRDVNLAVGQAWDRISDRELYRLDAVGYMEPDEIALYNYYYSKYGMDAAEEYLDTIYGELKYRLENQNILDMRQLAEDNPMWASVGSVFTSLASAGEYLNDLIYYKVDQLDGNYVSMDTNHAANVTNTIRGTVAEQVDWEIGNWDAFDFLYNTTMSGVDSVVAGTLFGGYGGVTLGLTAAAQGTNDALDRGMSDGQAFWSGLFSGVFECLFESISIGQFDSLKEIAPKNMKDILKNLGKSMLVNASEETLTEIANIAYDTLVNGEFANYTLEDLKNGAWKDALWQVLESGASGALMGLGIGSIANAVGYAKGNREAKRNYGSDPEALVGKALEIDPGNAFAQKMKGRLESGKSLSGGQLNRLVQQNEQTLKVQDMEYIKSVVAPRLTKLGETSDVQALASALAKQAVGERLGVAERRLIRDSKYGSYFSNELNPENISSWGYSSEETESIDTNRINAKEYSRLVEAAQLPQEAVETSGNQVVTETQSAAQVTQTAAVEPTSANDQQMTGKLIGDEATESEDGVTRQKSTGKEIIPQKIVSIKGNKVLIQTDTGTIAADDIQFGTKETDLLWRSAADFHGINTAGANGIIRAYESDQPVATYLNGAAQEFRNGYHNLSSGGEYADKLTSFQREIIYALGQKAAGENIAKEQAKKTKAKKSAASVSKTEKVGKVHFDRNGRTFDQKRETALKTMEQLSKALGVEFYVFESYVNKAGQRVYRDANGNEVHAPNGWYDPSDGSIHIDLNAGAGGKGAMLFTIAHELTHFIREWSPAKFKVLANFLIKLYGENGVSVKMLVEEQIKKAKKNGRTIDYDTAFEEVVADSMEAIMADGNVVQFMAELKQQDKALWQKICDWFKDLVNDLKSIVAAYKGVKPDSNEGKLVADLKEMIVVLESLYAEALVEASDNFQAAKVQKNTTQEGDVAKYSDRYLAADTNSEILSLVNRVANGEFKANEKVYLDTVSDAIANKIHELTGIRVNGFNVAIEARQIDHILRGHGMNGDTDHSMADPYDIAKMEYALSNPDDIRKTGKTQAYTYMRDGRNRTVDTVLYEKKIGDKSYYVVQAIPDTKAKTLYIVTAFIGNSGYKKEASQLINAKSLDATAKTGSASTSKVNVAQDAEEVKKKFSLRDTVEETRDLMAYHNITPQLLLEALNRNGLLMPSLAITNKGMTDFGEISLLFDKSTIDPNVDSKNKIYGADAWTPTQTQLKKNPKFDVNQTVRAVNDMKNLIGSKFVSELFNVTPKQFRDTIVKADGSIYDAYAHNIGMQTAYAIESGIISKVPVKNGVIDKVALEEQLNSELDTDNGWRQYKKWLNNISDTIITSYDAATNEDILQNMMAQPDTAKPFKLSESGDLVVPVVEYTSVEEMKRNRGRLDDNAAAATKAVADEFISFAKPLGNLKTVVNAINAAFNDRYSTTDIVKTFNRYGIKLSAETASELQALYKKAVELPTQYFEAKPQRAVDLNEIKAVVMPNDSSLSELKSKLESLGVTVVEYQAGSNESRVKALNSQKDLKFSDRDSDGNQLSEEQRDYFKDSKVRDKDGNLLVMYHGTKNGDFTVFDRKKAGKRTGFAIYGKGNYFTVFENGASNYGSRVIPAYLKIANPIITSAKTGAFATDVAEALGIKATEIFSQTVSERIKDAGFDGVIVYGIGEDEGNIVICVTYDSSQIKEVSNKNPTSDPDIRYSERDSDGTELSREQQEYFKNSKVRDEQGRLLVMHHGTPNGGFTKFRSGTYFTQNASYADVYQSPGASSISTKKGAEAPMTYKVYLDIKKPFDTRNAKERRIFLQEFYRKYGTGTPLADSGLPDWVDGMDLQEFIEEMGYDYDGLILDEGGVGGYGDDVKSRGLSYVVFSSEQVKDVGNKTPTDDPDFRYSERDPELEKVNKVLEKENAQLKHDVAYLKELLKLQKQVTGGTKFTKTSVEAAARQLMKYSDAKGDTKELAGLLNAMYEYIAGSKELTWDGVVETAQPAVAWLQNHVRTRTERSAYAKDVLKEIRNSRIYLDETQKKEVAYQYGSYNEFRKKTMGSVILTDNATMSLDSQWHAWAEQYPNLFDPDMSSTDMPSALLEVLDSLRNMTETNGYGYERELFGQELLSQVYNSYWNVSTLYTVKDKAQKEINKLKFDHAGRMAKLKQYHKEQAAKLKQEHREDLQRIRQEMRDREEAKLKKLQDQYHESRKKMSENRHKAEMRRKIRRTVMDLKKILNNGDKNRNVKEDMKDLVTQALRSADILFTDSYSNEDMVRYGVGTDMTEQEAKYMAEAQGILAEIEASTTAQERQEAEIRLQGKLDYRMSKLKDVFVRERARLNKATVAEVLGGLADAYVSLENSDLDYVKGAFDENVYQYLTTLKGDVGGTTVKDMSLSQLEELHKAYTMVLTTVRNANKMFAANLKQTREQLGSQTINEVKQAGGERKFRSKAEKAANAFAWNNQKPVYAFEWIGSETLKTLFDNTRAGEDRWALDMIEAREFYLEQVRKFKYDSWDFGKQYKFTSSSGTDFVLNLEQIMSLYAYSKREQAHDHLLKGGFVFDEATEVIVEKARGIKQTMLLEDSTAYNVSMEILAEIVSKLNAEQKAFVDQMQDFLSTTMGDKGNEVSMQLYGVKLFNEKFYFPLRSAGQYMEQAKEADLKKQQGQISIVNSGFAKSTKPKSSNPVVLSGFMDVWADHVNDMSMYHSFVLPMEDFRRVYNYSSPSMESQAPVSVNSTIRNAYGKAATDYIDQLYRDLNGGAVADPRENLIKSLVSKFKKAAVFTSLSVVVQQPSAIGRAFAVIDPKYFIGSKVDSKRHKALWSELKQYAPVAAIKEMGYFDTGMGKSAHDFITGKEYNGLKEKVVALFTDGNYRDEVLSKAPALADELTWCAIWDAAKRETKAKNPKMDVKSEEFLRLAGKRFTEVITKTQVYDSVLSRSANMRSKGVFMSIWTAFMAEPTTSINMVEDALRKAKKGDKGYAARAMGAVMTSIVLNSLLSSLIYAMRDDDEDETFLEKYVQSFSVEMLDGINPLTYYPFLKDVWSTMQGFDIERSDMSLITSLTDSVTKLIQTYIKDTDDMDEEEIAEHKKDLAGSWWGVVDYVTALFGIPVKNVRRDINGAINMVKTIGEDLNGRDTTWGSLLDKTWDNAKNSLPVVGWFPDETAADKLYKATVNGDTAYQKRLESSYKTEKSLNNAIRKGLRNNDARIWEAAIAWNNNDLEGYKRIAKEIIAEGYFSQDNVVMAIQAEAKAMLPTESNSTDSKAKGYFTMEKFAVAISQGNISMAATIKADIIETAQKNGKTAEEAEKNFTSSAKTDMKELFLAGSITATQAIDALTEFCGVDEEDAQADVLYWDFQKEYPDTFVDDSWIDEYYEEIADSGIAIDVFVNYRNQVKGITGENKKEARMAVIDSMNITIAQKDALYYAEGWAKSKIHEAPWH